METHIDSADKAIAVLLTVLEQPNSSFSDSDLYPIKNALSRELGKQKTYLLDRLLASTNRRLRLFGFQTAYTHYLKINNFQTADDLLVASLTHESRTKALDQRSTHPDFLLDHAAKANVFLRPQTALELASRLIDPSTLITFLETLTREVLLQKEYFRNLKVDPQYLLDQARTLLETTLTFNLSSFALTQAANVYSLLGDSNAAIETVTNKIHELNSRITAFWEIFSDRMTPLPTRSQIWNKIKADPQFAQVYAENKYGVASIITTMLLYLGDENAYHLLPPHIDVETAQNMARGDPEELLLLASRLIHPNPNRKISEADRETLIRLIEKYDVRALIPLLPPSSISLLESLSGQQLLDYINQNPQANSALAVVKALKRAGFLL